MTIESLLQLLRARAEESSGGGDRAFTFIDEVGAELDTLTYSALDRRARAIGAEIRGRLRGRSAVPVLLLFAPGLAYVEAFFGAIYGGAIPVPAYPPEPARLERTLPRLLALVRDARAELVLTSSDIAMMGQHLGALAPELTSIDWIAVDALPSEAADDWREPSLAPDDVCFLQYTSGSTSEPKGVMVTHRNLLANQQMIAAAMGNDASTIGVSWLPMYHDMGLIGHIVQPLYLGIHSVLMSPLTFLKQPIRWLDAISKYRASTSGGPNFAYDLCTRRVTDEEIAALDLSSWRVAYSGAEPVREETLTKFVERFAPAGLDWRSLFPCYGLAEATLLVTGGPPGTGWQSRTIDPWALERGEWREDPEGRAFVTCGAVPDGTEVEVVDLRTRLPASAGRVGEIWVRGPHVASGYWGDAAATEETFGARLADGWGPFLRTGDLGCRLEGEGGIAVTGRLKDLILVGGRNHYPQDLELTAERSHPSLRRGCAAAFTLELGDEPHLIIAIEVERRLQHAPRAPAKDRRGSSPPPGNDPEVATRWDATEVATLLRKAIWREHALAVHSVALLTAGTIPKTSSGKIQRSATRQAFVDGELEAIAVEVAHTARRERPYQAPETSAEELIARIWQEVLDVERVGREDTFVELGGDSVQAAQVVWRAREQGLELSMQSMFEHPTLAALAEAASLRSTPTPHGSSPGPRDTSLTSVELDLLSSEPREATGPAITIVRSVGVDHDRLGRALEAVVQAHDALRSRYVRDGNGWQRTPSEVAIPLRRFDPVSASEIDAPARLESLTASLVAELSATEGPLLVAGHLELDHPNAASRPSRLLLALHPLLADEVSWIALLDDLDRAYRHLEEGRPVVLPARVALNHWAQWARARAESPPREAVELWMAQLDVPASALGASDSTGSTGEDVVVRALPGVGSTLERLTRERGVNVLELLSSATLLALRQLTGEAVRIDVHTSGRDNLELDVSRTIGRFATLEPLALNLESVEAPSEALGLLGRHVARLRELGIPFSALGWYHPDEPLRARVRRAPKASLTLRYGERTERIMTLPRLGLARIGAHAVPVSGTAELTGVMRDSTLELRLRFDASRFLASTMAAFLDECVAQLDAIGRDRGDRGPGLVERYQDASLSDAELAHAIARGVAARKKSSNE